MNKDDKIAFVGTDEIAKTTLFKILAGEMEARQRFIQMGCYDISGLLPKR